MNLNDVIIVGTHPIALRTVLGLMEDAENSQEAYRWALPAMMHAYDTSDDDLRQYIARTLQFKGLKPYEPYQEKETGGKQEVKTNEQVELEKMVYRSQVKMVVEELMALKDANGDPLFCQKNHWWVIYRLFVERNVDNLQENRYEEFLSLIQSLNLGHVNAELDKGTLSNITQDIYRYPFGIWKSKIPADASTRWMNSFNRMYQLADELLKILIKKGF